MNEYSQQVLQLVSELEKLHHRLDLSKAVGPDYFEPGMMEYLDQSEGQYDAKTGNLLLTEKGKSLGHMPAELCNAMAPLYDAGALQFRQAKVSFVEPISKRSRHAKQAVLFVELEAKLNS